MRILNWEGTVIKGFEVTTNEMGWIEKGRTFAINLKALGVYIVFERVHNDRIRRTEEYEKHRYTKAHKSSAPFPGIG